MVANQSRRGGGRTKPAGKASGRANRPATSARLAPRADKGDGEAAVQARIAALREPSRSILTRLHPLIMKHAKGLQPVVRYGFAVYLRSGKMVLLAAPRKAYVTFGYTNDAGIDAEPVKYSSPEEVDEAKVAEIVQRLEG